jgi:hypothetical protein
VRLEGLGQLKKTNGLIGNITRVLPASSIVSTNYATACPSSLTFDTVFPKFVVFEIISRIVQPYVSPLIRVIPKVQVKVSFCANILHAMKKCGEVEVCL